MLTLHFVGSEKLLWVLARSAFLSEETELMDKHEEILEQRAELLEQMESRREQLKMIKKQQVKDQEAARHRNAVLLQDLQKIEDGLRGRQLPHPTLLALETRYWASVEDSIPAWEQFLLGRAPHPTPGRTPSTAKDQGLPPRPKLSTAR